MGDRILTLCDNENPDILRQHSQKIMSDHNRNTNETDTDPLQTKSSRFEFPEKQTERSAKIQNIIRILKHRINWRNGRHSTFCQHHICLCMDMKIEP
jgi:hypothetical protein